MNERERARRSARSFRPLAWTAFAAAGAAVGYQLVTPFPLLCTLEGRIELLLATLVYFPIGVVMTPFVPFALPSLFSGVTTEDAAHALLALPGVLFGTSVIVIAFRPAAIRRTARAASIATIILLLPVSQLALRAGQGGDAKGYGYTLVTIDEHVEFRTRHIVVRDTRACTGLS